MKIKLKKGETKQTIKEVKSLPQGHTGCRAEPEFRLEMVEPDGPPGPAAGDGRGPCGQGDPTHAEDWFFSLSDVAEV